MAKQLQRSNLQHETSASTRDTSLIKPSRVIFSKYSTQRVYTSDPHYEDSKSYTSADRKFFQKEAVNDALEIKRLVSSCHVPTGLAVQQLLKQRLLTREQLLGIDHLVSVNAEETLRKRESYIKLVLDMQQQIREKDDKQVDAEMLAVVAIEKSSRMIEKARLRALLAL